MNFEAKGGRKSYYVAILRSKSSDYDCMVPPLDSNRAKMLKFQSLELEVLNLLLSKKLDLSLVMTLYSSFVLRINRSRYC